MVTMVTDYSRHGDINEYIAKHHPAPQDFRDYRRRWNSNVDDLLFLLLETTSTCNLRCPVCAHSVDGFPHVPAMSDLIFNLCLDAIQEMKIPSISMNQNNEPLLDKKIIERIEQVVSVGSVFDVFMNTNAVLLTEDVGKQLIDSGLHRLLIGFDGFSKNVYEQMRVGANYGLVMKNITRFLNLKKAMGAVFPVVRISFVRSSINEGEINAWFDFWKEKVEYITIQEFITPVLDDSKSHLIPKSSLRKEVAGNFSICKQPFERAIIRGNGDVLPCCSPGAMGMSIGNITTSSLREIWGGREVAALREMFRQGKWQHHDICSKCIKISYGLA